MCVWGGGEVERGVVRRKEDCFKKDGLFKRR